MNFIAVHKLQRRESEVVYLNPIHISLIMSGADTGSVVLLSNGTKMELAEKPDDLILKIRGFTKPQIAGASEITANQERFSQHIG
jgi:uncharacterized protein YlzI (FlbEa/FlbD family)